MAGNIDHKSQHSRNVRKSAEYDLTGHEVRPNQEAAGIYRCRIVEYLGLYDGTQRYNVALITGQAATESFLIRWATVPDNSASTLSADTYALVVLSPGEPPVIVTGAGGGGATEAEYLQAIFLRSSD